MALRHIAKFLKLESASGIILFIAALMALILDNSPWALFYQLPVFWINEGLMTFFFLLVGLELKREFKVGELADFSKVLLPGVAAVGGMLIPALMYLAINRAHPDLLKGWAIPVATDIAFALGVLSLLGRRVPLGLKLFLMTLAIFDDVGAIIIIAVFYVQSLAYAALALAGVCLAALAVLNKSGVRSIYPYLLMGLLLWFCVLKSGVHPTVAGVLLAFMIPCDAKAERLENALHPWVAYCVLPLFAFANSGIAFQGMSPAILLDGVTFGIILALFLGKQLGVFCFSGLLIKLRYATLPSGASWLALYGTSILCGIGFTMSLFLGTLAFQGDYLPAVRLGVLFGSLLSGVTGIMVLQLALRIKVKRGKST